MTEKYISLDDVMTIIARKHLFKDKTDFDKCVHAIAEQVKALSTVEVVPLSVIKKMRSDIEDWQTDIHDNEYDAKDHDFVFERIFEIIDEVQGRKRG